MFDNNDDMENWFEEESEIDKIKKEHILNIERQKKQYERYVSLYTYVKSSSQLSLIYFYYQANAVEILNSMLNAFILKEEYEKCADVRDWIEDVKKHQEKAKEIKNYEKEKTLEKPITF